MKPRQWGWSEGAGPSRVVCSINQSSWKESGGQVSVAREVVRYFEVGSVGGVSASQGHKGAPGVDGQTIEAFESDLKNNLYRVWNRMASGSYFPPAVRAVPIPKADGGIRVLGVATVADRIAQTVVAARLEAVAVTRRRCWRKDWVLDLDIKSFFDSVDHDLLLKAVEANTDDVWVVLYIKRWLKAPLEHPDGTLEARDRGTPQGSAVSPVLANLFMHYAFDTWMDREHPGVTFCRYVDDVVVNATTLGQAERLRSAIAKRMVEVGLMLHPVKTKIVYCQDDNRRGSYEHESFTFLGFTFRARSARNKHGVIFASFLPAVSREALKAMGQRVRRWSVHLKVSSNLADLARWMNPIVRGWMQYYGRFYRTELYPLLKRINTYLMW